MPKSTPSREVTATPGWPPVAIPGRPGWWRHLIDGQQVDLPHAGAGRPDDIHPGTERSTT